MADFTVVNNYLLPDTWYAVTAAPSTVTATLNDVSIPLTTIYSDGTLFFKTPDSTGTLNVLVVPLEWSGDDPAPSDMNLDLTFVLSAEQGALGRALLIELKHRAVSSIKLTITSSSGRSKEVTPQFDADTQTYFHLVDVEQFDQTTLICLWSIWHKEQLSTITQTYVSNYIPAGARHGVLLSWAHDPFAYDGGIIGYEVYRGSKCLGVVQGCEFLDKTVTDNFRASAHSYSVRILGRGTTHGMNAHYVLGSVDSSDLMIQVLGSPVCLLSGSIGVYTYATIAIDSEIVNDVIVGGEQSLPVINGRINKYVPQSSVCTVTIPSLNIKKRFAVPAAEYYKLPIA